MSTPVSQAPAKPLPSFIQVGVPGEVVDKKYENREYKAQQLECVCLDDAGNPLQVGIIRVPQHLLGQVGAGYFRPVYGMRVDKDRVIQPVLLDLTPYKPAPATGVKGA